MNEDKLPCVDCITLAICKAKILELGYDESYLPFSRVSFLLSSKCSLIKAYLDLALDSPELVKDSYLERMHKIFNIMVGKIK